MATVAASDIDGLPAGASNFTDDKQQQWRHSTSRRCAWKPFRPTGLKAMVLHLRTPGSDTFVGDGFVHSGQGMAQFAGTVIETPNVSSFRNGAASGHH